MTLLTRLSLASRAIVTSGEAAVTAGVLHDEPGDAESDAVHRADDLQPMHGRLTR